MHLMLFPRIFLIILYSLIFPIEISGFDDHAQYYYYSGDKIDDLIYPLWSYSRIDSFNPSWFTYWENVSDTSIPQSSWAYLIKHGVDLDGSWLVGTDGIWVILNGTLYDETPEDKTIFPFIQFTLEEEEEYVIQIEIMHCSSLKAELVVEVDGVEEKEVAMKTMILNSWTKTVVENIVGKEV